MDPFDGEATIDRYADLARIFSDTARILFSAGSVDDTLARVVDVAVTTRWCEFESANTAAVQPTSFGFAGPSSSPSVSTLSETVCLDKSMS
jgi:hypothetical protein